MIPTVVFPYFSTVELTPKIEIFTVKLSICHNSEELCQQCDMSAEETFIND